MRFFAILLLLLTAGFGWALWQGIDLTAGLLGEATEEPETLVLGGVELTAAELGSDPLEAALREGSAAATPNPAQNLADALAETTPTPAATPDEAATPSAKAPPETTASTAEEAADDALPEVTIVAPGGARDIRRVTGDRVNLRQGPDVGTPSLGLLSLDTSVEVLEVRGDWLHVRTERREEGWVAARFLASP